ncbi:MAG TPA: hypothetical protein VK158_00160 [Acidobacteriota bacterium]|nr:hypothetical protein [Acidobacteriota bacterium]
MHSEHAHGPHAQGFLKRLGFVHHVLFFRSLEVSLTGIFSSIIMLKNGLPFIYILFFFIGLQLFTLPLISLCLLAIRKIGMERSIILSSAPTIVFYAFLAHPINELWWVATMALLTSLSGLFFWLPFHMCFTQHLPKKHTSAHFGWFEGLQIIGGTIGPLIGGLCLTFFDSKYLLVLAALLAAISTFPLFKQNPTKFTGLSIRFERSWTNLAFFCEGLARGALAFIWPIFLFILGISVLGLGIVYFCARIFTASLSILLSDMFDLRHRHTLKTMSWANSALFSVRAFFLSPAIVAFTTILGELFFTLLNVPFTQRWMELSRHVGKQIIVDRELWVGIGRASLLLLVLFNLVLFGTVVACIMGLVVGSISMLGLVFIERDMA